MPNLVVLTGAGISADSGLKTFRDSNGLWENHSIYDVATPEAWQRNPSLVLEFYNQRRKQLQEVKPNAAHQSLVELENDFNVQIITQNVDDLHERAGSRNVLHLHGELKKVRSTRNPNYIVEAQHWEVKLGEKCPQGGQLRPHVVWFGEAVPAMEEAALIAAQADVFLIVGTSLNVYPAAGLVDVVPPAAPIFLVDPAPMPLQHRKAKHIQKNAAVGLPPLIQEIKAIVS